jgi:hypothetical protein
MQKACGYNDHTTDISNTPLKLTKGVISYAKCCSNNVMYCTTISEAVEHSICVNSISVSISRRLNLIWYSRKLIHFQIRNCKQ